MNLIQLQAIDEFSISTRPVARCADGNGTLTPLFFSDHVLDIARAKAICAKCRNNLGWSKVSTSAWRCPAIRPPFAT